MSSVYPIDDPHLKCPNCGRAVRRRGSTKLDPNDKRPAAMLADGTCTQCWIVRKGISEQEYYRRKKADSQRARERNKKHKETLTEADYERLREQIRDMECDRLARGVPPEGINTRDWARGNGGLYASEIR